MIQLQQVELRRGPQALFTNADLTVFPGQKVGIIGANGCGKSSLFAMLQGKLHAGLSLLLRRKPRHWTAVPWTMCCKVMKSYSRCY